MSRPVRPTGHRLWKRPFLWAEWAFEWFDYGLGRLAVFQVLDKLGRLSEYFSITAAIRSIRSLGFPIGRFA